MYYSRKLALVLVLVLSTIAFVFVLWQVITERSILVLDDIVQAGLTKWRTPDVLAIFSWITLLGSTVVVFGFALIVMVVSAVKSRWLPTLGLVVSLTGALISMLVLKDIVGRTRPELLEGTVVTSSSFPSGNVVLATSLWASVLLVFFPLIESKIWRAILITIGIVTPILVAFSRLILSVHYLSDVVAALCLGIAWALAGHLLTRPR